MAARSPARFLAPLALLAVVVALWMIVTHSSDGGSGGSGAATTEQSTATPAKSARAKKKKHAKRYYTVKPGDTPSGIAEKTGVPLSTIEDLNPGLDPQALSPGTRLKLRR
jgi:LysM repeat protein